jgi:AcrR family transcriptional regulator
MTDSGTDSGTTLADAAATPAALLAAGLRLFTQRGYDGASVRAITAAAGANLGAITYHFGSKQALYEAVVAAGLEPLAAAVVAAARGPGPPLDRLERVVHTYFDAMAARPEMPQLLLHQIAGGKAPPRAAAGPLQRMLGALAAAVTEGQADGSVRAGDPVLLALSVVAQPLHLTVVRPVLMAFLDMDTFEPETRRRLAAHAAAFVRAGLAAGG